MGLASLYQLISVALCEQYISYLRGILKYLHSDTDPFFTFLII